MHLLFCCCWHGSRADSVFVCVAAERARRRAVRGGRWKGKGAPPPPLFASNARVYRSARQKTAQAKSSRRRVSPLVAS